jgi:hypothetical protein
VAEHYYGLACTIGLHHFLIAMRTQIDPHTFWILTGIVVPLAPRMGLHCDVENLKLPPFEAPMRQRLFWRLSTYARFPVAGT